MKQYTLIKLPLKELTDCSFHVTMNREEEIDKGYLIAQNPSLLFDQIERIRGRELVHLKEIILVTARKNPKQESGLRHILNNGFFYNGIHYNRFGKSASQAKDGITAFVCDDLYLELYAVTQMDIQITECVISKYEAQRCLPFSSCTVIQDYMPNIVIIGEYEKTLKHQFIKYVTETEKTYTDKETGEQKTYKSREIKEGYRDLKLSPFDGCGCHEQEFMEITSAQSNLDYNAAGVQVRLPFIKGYSVYVPFRKILKEWGYSFITDIYGVRHSIDTIDCIWNVSMFKGHKLFKEAYGNRAWTEYQNTLRKYQYKLGISKYSHHIKSLNKYTRMNFQYLQCLDLWNPGYIEAYEQKKLKDYDILDPGNDGKIISLARYTTELFERIIKGDLFYACKFMGITDSKEETSVSRYLKAVLINPVMRNDPAVRQFLYRKVKKSIQEAKTGKIYCSGFYHTGVGDMIGYLQYAVGEKPVGCLREREVYSGNFSCKDIVSFRSPLVDPSEVNRVKIVQNDTLKKWFGHFKDQDIVMFNMYDISAPQQGGADFDGDIFFLCDDPIVIDSKIEKPVILDLDDKKTVRPKPYIKENIVDYEMMSRDNRIGEITNAATSIENKYTTKDSVKKKYSDYASLLRVFQGKEIDFLKTGFRWHMNKELKKHLKHLPWFLLYNYPKKMDIYQKLQEKNKSITEKEDKLPLNAYFSPSPMNELCHYICTWEKKHILWNNKTDDFDKIRALILNRNLDLSDKKTIRIVRRSINEYANELRCRIQLKTDSFSMDEIINRFREKLSDALSLEEEIIANYVIKVSYQNESISKSLAWTGYGDYILKNLKSNSDPSETLSIHEVFCNTEHAYEYLGKYYLLQWDKDKI